MLWQQKMQMQPYCFENLGVLMLYNLVRHMYIAALFVCVLSPSNGMAQIMPDVIGAPGETKVVEFHAIGAQIYECKTDASGKLIWQLREPIATLASDGKSIGRHYAGPNWQLEDGSAVVGELAGQTPGASPSDIAWLKLDVVSHRGNGQLSDVTTVQRINTKGGVAAGACKTESDLLSVPYSADYVFFKRN